MNSLSTRVVYLFLLRLPDHSYPVALDSILGLPGDLGFVLEGQISLQMPGNEQGPEGFASPYNALETTEEMMM